MATNPRKFSEKIALHNQKQAEETAAFEQIMKEVGSAKPVSPRNGECPSTPSHLAITPISPFRAGSLPNVNSPSANSTSIDLQSALSNLEDMRAGRETGYRDRRSAGPGGGPYSPGNSSGRSRRSESTSSQHAYQMHPSGSMQQQMAGSVGSNMPVAANNMGGSLTTNTVYLSPPLDSSWRRTHSDSALHQAALTSNDPNSSSRRGQDGNHYLSGTDPSNASINHGLGVQVDGRPKSCCDVSRVPGINICPGPEPNGIQIPIGNSTGSLPDLTNLQFASPLSNPIDGDDVSLQANSLFDTSHNNLENSQPFSGNNGYSLNPSSGGGPSRGSSPGPSPSQRRRPHHALQNLQLRSHGHSSSSQNHSQQQQNQSSGVALDPSAGMSVPSYQSFLYQNNGSLADYVSPAHSPTHMMSQSQPIPTHGSLLTAYRNPQPILRPSPLSSPTLVVPGNMNYRSSSPGDGTNCVSSAPPSPVSQSLSPASSPGLAQSPSSPFTDPSGVTTNCQNRMVSGNGGNQVNFYHNQANVLNHQFEQFSMMDTEQSVQQGLGNHYQPNHYNVQQANLSPNMDISLDPYYGQSSSQFMFGRSDLNHQTTPQTPQTPSSIPDIVLQDYSSTDPVEELARQGFVKDLSSAMGSSFDGLDFYPSDEALRAGLDPIDFDGFQILTDSTLVTDPSTEDHFRLDRM